MQSRLPGAQPSRHQVRYAFLSLYVPSVSELVLLYKYVIHSRGEFDGCGTGAETSPTFWEGARATARIAGWTTCKATFASSSVMASCAQNRCRWAAIPDLQSARVLARAAYLPANSVAHCGWGYRGNTKVAVIARVIKNVWERSIALWRRPVAATLAVQSAGGPGSQCC